MAEYVSIEDVAEDDEIHDPANIQINLRLTQGELDAITRAARADRRSRNSFIRVAAMERAHSQYVDRWHPTIDTRGLAAQHEE